jgi:hypothetical protein
LDLGQLRGLEQGVAAGQDGVEEVEQQQCGVVVGEELAVAGLIGRGAAGVETLEERQDLVEIPEALEILGRSGSGLRGKHGGR